MANDKGGAANKGDGIMLNINIDGYNQISKPAARKLYNDGATVYLCAANMNYISIERRYGCVIIRAEYGGIRYPEQSFFWYSKRDAIKRYRALHGLTGKHLTKI
jgi:hypothetical protein